MKNRFCGSILVLVVCTVCTLAQVPSDPQLLTTKQWGGLYRKCETEKAKLNLVIDMIDNGVFDRYEAKPNLAELFGTDVDMTSGELGKACTVYVRFHKQSENKDPTIQVPYVGWYLFVATGNDGTVRSFSLSTAGK